MATLWQAGARATRALCSGNAVASTSKCAWTDAAMAHHLSKAASPASFLSSAAFSTTPLRSAAKKATKTPAKRKTKIKKSTNTNKTRRRGDGAATLSRTNPFLAQRADMSQLRELLPDYATETNVNNVYALSRRTLDAVKWPSGFGLTTGLAKQFQAMPRPRTLLRPQSLQLFGMLDEAGAHDAKSGPTNALLHAPSGAGMSTLLLQSLSYALESGWIVLMISRGALMVDSSSPYVYSEAQQTYLQPDLARGMLEQLLAVNEPLLSKVTVQDATLSLPGNAGSIQKGANLAEVAKMGTQSSASPEATQSIFEVTLRTLAQQREVPVLVAIDGLQGLFSTSHYRDPDYRALQSFELAVPRAIHACLRRKGLGACGGIQRGMMLSTLSLEHKEWPIPRELAMAHPVLAPHLVEPYAKLDETMLQLIQDFDMRIVDLSHSAQLTQPEAGALLDIARKEGGLWSPANDEFLMAKLVQSGGSMGAFDRSLRKTML